MSFRCAACAFVAAKWLGRCPECGAWGSLEEAVDAPRRARSTRAATPVPYPSIREDGAASRSTGIDELDRVLGGGLVAGAAVLLGGEPGIGKSTLLLQAASSIAAGGGRVLYVAGEESAPQLRLRGERLGVTSPDLRVLADTDVDVIVETAREGDWTAVFVDSIQSVRCPDVASIPGSVAQVRESAARLVGFAKAKRAAVVLVGHVTKDGALAGPRALEHLVDTVLQFEGDRHHDHRLLRAVKNRFGHADELGVFRMTDRGLAPEPNPSALFLPERDRRAAGSAILAAIEGSRALLVEVQALVGDPVEGSPRRTALGIDGSRLALILAVLARSARIDVSGRDVFVNVTGGLHVSEPAADLAVAAAVASSYLDRPIRPGRVVAGELGLTGEVRSVGRLDARLREAARAGFDHAIVPCGESPLPSDAPEVARVADVSRALEALVGAAAGRPGTPDRTSEVTA